MARPPLRSAQQRPPCAEAIAHHQWQLHAARVVTEVAKAAKKAVPLAIIAQYSLLFMGNLWAIYTYLYHSYTVFIERGSTILHNCPALRMRAILQY